MLAAVVVRALSVQMAPLIIPEPVESGRFG
jgi:hypothetical protein